MNETILKSTLSIVALAVIVLREKYPAFLDSIDLVLIAFAVIPWLSSLIHRAELPGGFKIEFRAIQDAGAKITGQKSESRESETPQLFFLGIADADPNLALVGLRIEIERRLRALAREVSLDDRQPLMRLFRQLQKEGVVSDPVLSGVQELVMFGNHAAHGAQVDRATVAWAMDVGPQVLAVLDENLSNRK